MVVGVAVLLGLFLAPMLFFSGSQTRSLQVEGQAWHARYLARAGLEAAGDRLRKERWYGETDVVGSLTSAEAGLAGPGSFHVVCEDTRIFSPEEQAGFQSLPLVHHVDVFSRGEEDGRSVVGYAAFILNPAPELAGKATDGFDGLGETTGDTLKRLVRFHFFVEPALQGIEEQAVRDAIRARVEDLSREYIANYPQVDWGLSSNPPEPSGPRLGVGEAAAYLARYQWGAPADAASVFYRDRIFDMVLEGTPATQRAVAQKLRQVSIRASEEGEALRAEARHFCELVSGCQWGPFPPDQELVLLPPNAVGVLHEIRGGIPDADYRRRLSAHDCAKLYYEWGAEATEPETMSEAAVQAAYPGKPYALWNGAWWVDYYAERDENPCVSADYFLDDPASGIDMELDDIYGFFRKYFALEEAEPLGGLGIDKSDPISMGYLRDQRPPAPLGLVAGDDHGSAEVKKRAAF